MRGVIAVAGAVWIAVVVAVVIAVAVSANHVGSYTDHSLLIWWAQTATE